VTGTARTALDGALVCNRTTTSTQIQEFLITGTVAVSDLTCDEDQCNLNAGTFFADVLVSRRNIVAPPLPGSPRRGCFSGIWRIVSAGREIARGTMSGSVEAGTHNGIAGTANCESCAPRFHFEGALNGTCDMLGTRAGRVVLLGQDGICASIQGTGLDPAGPAANPPGPDVTAFTMRVEGAQFANCFNSSVDRNHHEDDDEDDNGGDNDEGDRDD